MGREEMTSRFTVLPANSGNRSNQGIFIHLYYSYSSLSAHKEAMQQ